MKAAAIKQLSVSYHVCSKQNQISSNRATQMEGVMFVFLVDILDLQLGLKGRSLAPILSSSGSSFLDLRLRHG